MLRDETKSWVGGVAAGLADEYDVSVYLIRLLFVAGFFLFGIGLAIYAWLWFTTPGGNNQIGINFSA